jgi:hypothetical protein
MRRPDPSDHAPFFQGYVDRVPDGDVLAHLERQGRATCALLVGAGEAKGAFAYAPGKWTVKRLVQHVVDGERLFVYRAMCVARGDVQNLPGFDEDAYAAHDGSDGRLLADVVAEFAAVRVATILFFRGLDGPAWTRVGTANGRPIAVRAFALDPGRPRVAPSGGAARALRRAGGERVWTDGAGTAAPAPRSRQRRLRPGTFAHDLAPAAALPSRTTHTWSGTGPRRRRDLRPPEPAP